MSYLLLYIPITFITLVIIEMTKRDDPKEILRRSLKDFGIMTGAFLIGGLIIFLINRYL